MSGSSSVASPSCAAEALAMAEVAFDYLNACDMPGLPVATQSVLLQGWARVRSKQTAAYVTLLHAFQAGGGPAADGQRSLAAWLAHFTRCTLPAGKGQSAESRRWSRRHHAHQAMVDGDIRDSYARWIADVVDKFDHLDRDTMEQILVKAAREGALLEDLVEIATAAFQKLRPGGLEDEETRRYLARGLTVSKTLGGAGRINGDLTPEATAAVDTVIEALAVKKGPEDTRTKNQRRHDALHEAMQRLLASDLLPQRGGSKPQVKVGMDLASLRKLPGSAKAEEEWIRRKSVDLSRRRCNGATTQDLLGDPEPVPETPSAPHRAANAEPAPAGADTAPAGPAPSEPADTSAANPAPQPPEPGSPEPGSSEPRSPEPRSPEPGSPVPESPERTTPPEPSGLPVPSGHSRPPATHSGPPARDAVSMSESESMPEQTMLPGLGSGAALEGIGPISNTLAGGLACDSILTPIVTGTIDHDALRAMTDEWLNHHIPPCADHTTQPDTPQDDGPPERPLGRPPGTADPPQCGCAHNEARAMTPESYTRLQNTMLRWAIKVLSGPDGLASYLRTRVLTGPLSGASIVLDAGTDDRTVPAALERLVRRRDEQCRFPGCDHPAAHSQVHHIVPRSENGPSELTNLLTLCSFHHLTAIHAWGWDITLNPDGTTTATAPDGRRLHEHNPPGTPPLWAA